MKKTAFWPLLLLACCLLTGCSSTPLPGEKITVTASIFPLADVVRNVGGERVDVEVLIPPGASPHIFEPSPEAFRQFASSRLFVAVGAGLEFWAERLIAANAAPDLVVVRAAQGVRLIQMGEHRREEQSDASAEKATSAQPAGRQLSQRRHEGEEDAKQMAGHLFHRQGNPHVWLDPVLVRSLAGRICQALSQIDPDHAQEYGQRREQYQRRLDQLHRTIEETVAGFRITQYVTFHPAWSYFSRRYGLQEVGVIQESPGRDPTPRQIEKIVQAIHDYGIEAVFAEPQHHPAAAEAIAREAGVRVLILDPLGGPDLAGRDSYIALMEYNLAIMKEAMR